ncbi:hypothetical protein ANCCEY_00828 [Ancylostoma ceylanicum]|uniref:EGF-like domain-containing protein n=1 Tax=Ancylostoma ceylanicum TaxID=53326 RepID=A0A0D6M7P1_9BILA|nr:hypothetical protein ANCCEY_00828 [Ancylostoma ceylanicum]
MYVPLFYRVTEIQGIHLEGCLPSWFRDDRSDAQALEKNDLEQNEVDFPLSLGKPLWFNHWLLLNLLLDYLSDLEFDCPINEPPELLETSHSTVKDHSHHSHETHHPHPHETNELGTDHGGSYDSESEELDALYGTAAPVRIDHKLEEARRRHAKHRCKGWCYRGGNCSVDIDEVTYELRSVNCHCPPGYWGSRCELHFVARLFAPVKGHVEVEKSGVSAFAFIILMLWPIVCESTSVRLRHHTLTKHGTQQTFTQFHPTSAESRSADTKISDQNCTYGWVVVREEGLCAPRITLPRFPKTAYYSAVCNWTVDRSISNDERQVQPLTSSQSHH